MSFDTLLNWTYTSFDAGMGHFSKIFDHTSDVNYQKEEEMQCTLTFFEELNEIDKSYKNQLEDLCLKFQKKVHDAFSDEKVQQFFQMMFNNLLYRCDNITTNEKYCIELKDKLSTINENLQSNVQPKINMLNSEMTKFNNLLEDYKKNYTDYLKKCDSVNENCHKKVENLNIENDELSSLKDQIRETSSVEDRLKMLDKIAAYRNDVGKKDALKIKEKYKSKKGKNEWEKAEITQFKLEYLKLQEGVFNQIKTKQVKIRSNEKAQILGTEKKIVLYTQKAEQSHLKLSKALLSYLDNMQTSLYICGKHELCWKEQTISQIIDFMIKYFPERKDDVLKKKKNTEKNMEEFLSKFGNISKVF